MVKDLRAETGAGVLDCKKALDSTGGDYDQAVGILKEKGLARAQKRAGREANEGLIEMYSHTGGRVGVILELNCETDFVARTVDFQELAHEIALHVAAASPRFVSIESVPAEVLESKADEIRQTALDEGKPQEIAEKIVEGRLSKFYEEEVLLEQDYIRDEDKKIKELINDAVATMGETIRVRRFVRYELGEEL